MNNQSGFLHVNTAQDKTLEINFRLILRTKKRKKKARKGFWPLSAIQGIPG